ncbi:Tubulin-binding cofactor C-like protein [Elsinoe fawcettii]|nr:Tubulin-binding cofactor C-like protein [Elsinoe fawcettii]
MSSQNVDEADFQSRTAMVRKALRALEEDQRNKAKTAQAIKAELDLLAEDLSSLTKSRDHLVTLLPAHGQKTVNEAVKSLTVQYDSLKTLVQPRQKFSFKKKSTTSSTSAAATPPPLASFHAVNERSAHLNDPTDESASTSLGDSATVSEPLFTPSATSIVRRTSFSSIPLRISSHESLHLSLSPNAKIGGKTATLLSLSRSVLNLSSASTQVLSTLSAKNISHSLLLLGRVDGAVHLTALTKSVVVVSCRQFRMHESRDVDVYLYSGSDPVIEDCKGIRFGGIPEVFKRSEEGEGQWHEVKDFNWVGAGASSNWRALEAAERVDDAAWESIQSDSLSREEALQFVKIDVTE